MEQERCQIFTDWVLDQQEQFNQSSLEKDILLEAKNDGEKKTVNSKAI